jgi:maleylpyruvate isomerase
MRQGTAFLLEFVFWLSDAELRAPSSLPGWSRAHIIGHLARNAEALLRLASWARSGVECPMYASPAQRNDDIETSAQKPVDTLRTEVVHTAAELESVLQEFDNTAWHATLRSAQGRQIEATELPWMRIREVWLHAIDLGAGAQLTDLPADLCEALIDDAAATVSSRDNCPSALLEPADSKRRWLLGAADEPWVTLRGSTCEILGWLTGRSSGAHLTATCSAGPTPVPQAIPWL